MRRNCSEQRTSFGQVLNGRAAHSRRPSGPTRFRLGHDETTWRPKPDGLSSILERKDPRHALAPVTPVQAARQLATSSLVRPVVVPEPVNVSTSCWMLAKRLHPRAERL